MKRLVFAALAFTASIAIAGELNQSSRAYVEYGDRVLIGGIIVGGQETRVVIRAIGPSLKQYGLDALENPALYLHDGNGQVLDVQNSYFENSRENLKVLEESGLTPTDARECAMVKDLAEGNYTAIVRGQGKGNTGIALVEFYKLN